MTKPSLVLALPPTTSYERMSKRRPERPSFQSAVVAGEYGQASKLRIAFIHPDLGIGEFLAPSPRQTSTSSCSSPSFGPGDFLGGAERLVVDAAVGLQKRGHTVEIFTSHHDDSKGGRSFEETRDGAHFFLLFLYSSVSGQSRVLSWGGMISPE